MQLLWAMTPEDCDHLPFSLLELVPRPVCLPWPLVPRMWGPLLSCLTSSALPVESLCHLAVPLALAHSILLVSPL